MSQTTTHRPHIESFMLGEYQTNCFVVTVPDAEVSECLIVDCGFAPEPMLEAVERRGLTPARLLLTHAHPDHIAGVEAARARFGPLPVALHEAERGFCSDPMLNLSAAMGAPVTCGEPEEWLTDGDVVEFHGARFDVVHLPGHSPGCVAFVDRASNQAIVGDTLFAGSMGRVDFPTSDPRAMQRSLARMMEWPDAMEIHPGHGPSTTIGQERAGNPFVR